MKQYASLNDNSDSTTQPHAHTLTPVGRYANKTLNSGKQDICRMMKQRRLYRDVGIRCSLCPATVIASVVGRSDIVDNIKGAG